MSEHQKIFLTILKFKIFWDNKKVVVYNKQFSKIVGICCTNSFGDHIPIVVSHIRWLKVSQTSTSPQLKYSKFVYIMSHFPRLHYSATLWLFLDFSCVLGISCVLLHNSLRLHLNLLVHTETLLQPFYWNNCYLFVVKFKL